MELLNLSIKFWKGIHVSLWIKTSSFADSLAFPSYNHQVQSPLSFESYLGTEASLTCLNEAINFANITPVQHQYLYIVIGFSFGQTYVLWSILLVVTLPN